MSGLASGRYTFTRKPSTQYRAYTSLVCYQTILLLIGGKAQGDDVFDSVEVFDIEENKWRRNAAQLN